MSDQPLRLGPGRACECPDHGCDLHDRVRPEGVYATIRFDDPEAEVALRRVVVMEESAYDDIIQQAKAEAIDERAAEMAKASIYSARAIGQTLSRCVDLIEQATRGELAREAKAEAWGEGHAAGCTDPYAKYGECGCGPNPYRDRIEQGGQP